MIRLICFFLFIWQITLSAQIVVSGKVVSEDGRRIVGAHIAFDSKVEVTDTTGIFQLTLPIAGSYPMSASAVGYAPYSQPFLIKRDTFFDIILTTISYDLDPIELSSSWIKPDQPFTYVELSEKALKEDNFGKDVPYLLQAMPSSVVTSDAGTGIGYTGIRIRGSDPSRINVTLDGIPVNDAESQAVFWVDLPDLASNAAAIQVQRGVGTSTNGAGAFGGTINVRTMGVKSNPYASVDLTVGSFNTLRANAKFGSGLITDKISVQGSLSKIASDGYIDRAASALQSMYLSATYLTTRQSVKINLLRGKEKTYQAWNGVPAQYVSNPTTRTYNTAGLKADGTFHDNEVDDYGQTHLHLIYQYAASEKLQLKTAMHYTHGEGFFEQFRNADFLSDYFLTNAADQTDLIRRRWLDNDFYGGIFTAKVGSLALSDLTFGGGINRYVGRHFGEVIWQEIAPDLVPSEYYRNQAVKEDANLFVQWQKTLTNSWRLFGDLQWRMVDYRFEGLDQDLESARQKVAHHFFNPKGGIHYEAGNLKAYYSLGVANREPNRDDYVRSTPASRPKAERLIDHELGAQVRLVNLESSLNLFFMDYRDQLVLSGQINDVGEYARINVDKSSRVGLEYALGWQTSRNLKIAGNATWNRSRISRVVEAVDDWDQGGQQLVRHRKVPISFSPEWVGYTEIEYTLLKNQRKELRASLSHKYVGKQYLDNTGRESSLLKAYQHTDLNLMMTFLPGKLQEITLKCQIVNLLNRKIISNGWIYRFISAGYDPTSDDPHASYEDGSSYNLKGYYPQAGTHAFVGLHINF